MAESTAAPGQVAEGPEEAPQTRATVTLPRPEPEPQPTASTVVIEDGVIPRRLRRPLDLARFVLAAAIVAVTVLIAYFATSTTAGLEEDLTGGASLLPAPVILILNIIAGIGLVGLPVAAAIGLVIRRRAR